MKISSIAMAAAAAILSVTFVTASAHAANERDTMERPSGLESPGTLDHGSIQKKPR